MHIARNYLICYIKYLLSLEIVKNCLKENIILVSSIPNKYFNHRVIILNRGIMIAFQLVKRISPAVKLRPQTLPIDKREIGDGAIPGERRIQTSPSPSPPPQQLWPLANEPALSSDVTP